MAADLPGRRNLEGTGATSARRSFRSGAQVQGKTKSVLAGSYADDKGKTAIVITSDHSVPGRAVFSIDGNPKLTSKYGLTRQLPSGEWLFESNTVSSDILYQ